MTARLMIKHLSWIVILSLSVSGLAGCSEKAATDSSAQIQNEKKPVEVMAVQSKAVTTVSELSGTLEPIEETTLSFEIPGQIHSLKLKEGDSVSAGQLIAELDSTDYSLQLALASADVSRAKATLSKIQNGSREQEKAQMKSALEAKQINLDKAKKDYGRMEELYDSGAISQFEYENAKKAWDLAQKDVESAMESYSLVLEGARPEDVASTEASYQAAIVAQSQAANVLEKTKLESPISGTVIARLADEGQLAGAGTPIFRIGNMKQMKVDLPVPDKEIKSWVVGDSVELQLYEQKRTGKVNKIYPVSNQQTGTLNVEVILDNSKHDWFAGQVVSARKVISKKEGIFIPAQAVISRGAEPFVFCFMEDKAVRTPVTLGGFIDGQVEITSGLRTGDQVIILGADLLLDGDSVTIREEGNDD